MAVMRVTVEPARKKLFEVIGAYIALSCIVGVPLVLFLLAPACNYVGSFMLLLLGFGLIAGIVLWLIGKFGVRTRREPDIPR